MKIWQTIKLMVTRAKVSLFDDSKPLAQLQVESLSGKPLDNVELLEPYGFTSKGFNGDEVLIINIMGSQSHPIALSLSNRRHRLKNKKDGEVAIYDDLGQTIYLTREGIKINAPLGLTITGKVNIEGDANITGTLTNNGVNLTTHKHSESIGSITGTPQ